MTIFNTQHIEYVYDIIKSYMYLPQLHKYNVY